MRDSRQKRKAFLLLKKKKKQRRATEESLNAGVKLRLPREAGYRVMSDEDSA